MIFRASAIPLWRWQGEDSDNKSNARKFAQRTAVFCIIFQLFFSIQAKAQLPADVRISALIIQSLRYKGNTQNADDIMKEVISRKHSYNFNSQPFVKYNYYQKTSVDIIANKETTQERIQSNEDKGGSFYRRYIVPFEGWLDYAREIPNTDDLALTVLLYEDYGTISKNNKEHLQETKVHASRDVGFFETLGKQNISQLLDEMFGNIDLYRNDAELMLLNFKTPLADDALKIYEYRLLGFKNINGNDCYEIAFYAKNPKDNAFAGYLYVDISSLALCKAIFTLNNPENMNFLKNVLITHSYTKIDDVIYPVKKESALVLGDGFESGLSIVRTLSYSNYDFEKTDKKNWKSSHDENYYNRDSLYWDSVRPFPLTPAQTQIDGLIKIAPENNGYIRLQELFAILLSNYVTVGGINGKVELGPLSQFLSYNDMEGLRLRVGGNTTTALFDRLQIGGYVAYGLKDERLKYRGDLIYSIFPREKYIWEYPKRLLSFTYVNDLNIPGQNLLTTNRDNLVYSFSHTSTDNMSLQKIGYLTFENENKHNFSYVIGAKYTSDNPVGVVKYMKVSGLDTTTIDRLNTAELTLSLRYSPRERFFQNRDKRIPIRRGDVELQLNHRVGLKNVFGSGYNYQITSADAYKKIGLGNTVGALDLRLSCGMVWNKVPFPLLLIPIGNQSYIFQTENYNNMNFYEFTTDRFVAGNVNFLFNWSPMKWISENSKIKTSMGARAIYGPLSDKNNPERHSDLFIFNKGVTPLGKQPYVEANIGLVNVFKFLRIEYVHRLTYVDRTEEAGNNKLTKGSLLVTGSFAF
ncbi:MAG: DUF5686 family protein [Candidatus Azobacteroides sp.]|nr:DUF5686 family protein [Candidatus Azobacteroides sp.]